MAGSLDGLSGGARLVMPEKCLALVRLSRFLLISDHMLEGGP
jgi:hypothetical protein